jgi:hypothetical protein
MENKITNARLNFSCNQNWEAMEQVAEGRFCNACQKKVYDLRNENVAYFARILQENNNSICGMFSSDQMLKTPKKPYWKKWLVAAMVFIGFNAFAEKLKAQEKTIGVVAKEPTASGTQPVLLGEVVCTTSPAQLKTLHAYLVKQCKIPASVNGRIVASFILGRNGVLEHLAVSNHLGAEVRTEVLRALKAAPKWKNAEDFYGNPYSLNLDFKNGKINPYPATQK